MSEQSQNYLSQFSIEELEPLEFPFMLEIKDTEMNMIEVQQNSIDSNIPSTQSEDLDNIFDFLSQGTSTNIQESAYYSQNSQSYLTEITSDPLRAQRVRRAHLNRSRRKRGNQRSELELQFNGYWTKNFLQNGKNPHFKWLLKELGPEFFSDNPLIEAIKLKEGISMSDYLYLYTYEGLKDTWQKFFNTKILFREIMLSRAQGKSKVMFMKFLHRFEEAFRTGQFDHIA